MADTAKCRVLGPLEVVVGYRDVPLGGQRPRALLAALLLEAGHAVPMEGLAEAVWGTELPGSVRSQVSIHVSALRKAFARAGCVEDVIETTPGGYRLRSDAVRIDARLATEHIDKAREAAAQGRTDEAIGLFQEALDTWRGPTLAGLDSPALAARTARWDELRLAATEERVDLELAAGRHNALVGELRSLVAEHPFREQVRVQLMLALARAGRQADALEVFRDGRRCLVDELGLEPGPELRRLEQAILTAEVGPVGRVQPEIAVQPPGAHHRPEPAAAVPNELPGDVATFTGRAAEVDRICELVTSAERGTVTIAGPGGIGKSTLAIHVAHRVAESFPDGQLYVNLHGSTPDTKPLDPAEALAQFLRSLGVPTSEIPVEADDAAALFRSLTAGRRLLLLLDNAAEAPQVRPLLPGSASCAVLITSRQMVPSLDTAADVRLDVLRQDEAMELLAQLTGRARLEHEPDDAAEVVRRCGRLPLALAIAGARIAARPSWPVRELADRLAVEQRRLGELSVDDLDVRASFMVSYKDIDESGAARMFRLLGLLDGPDIDVTAAAALADVPAGRAELLLDQLVDAQLADAHSPGRYRLHDLLRLFARERAVEEEEEPMRAQAVQRALNSYLASARTATMVVAPSYAWRIEAVPTALTHGGIELASVDQVKTWIEVERENVLAAAYQAVDVGAPRIAVGFTAALAVPLEYRGRWHDQVRIAKAALQAARHTGDPAHYGLAYNDLGWALVTLSRPEESITQLEHALRMWREIGHGKGEALALHGLGVSYRAVGRLEESLDCLERARARAREAGNHGRAATCLTAIGLTYQRQERYREAVTAHEGSVDLANEAGSWRTAVMALGNLGEAHRLAGEPERAALRFREALETGRAGGYEGTYWEAEHLWGLGSTLHELGIGGHDAWRQSARILQTLGLIGPGERAAIERAPVPDTPAVIVSQL